MIISLKLIYISNVPLTYPDLIFIIDLIDGSIVESLDESVNGVWLNNITVTTHMSL